MYVVSVITCKRANHENDSSRTCFDSVRELCNEATTMMHWSWRSHITSNASVAWTVWSLIWSDFPKSYPPLSSSIFTTFITKHFRHCNGQQNCIIYSSISSGKLLLFRKHAAKENKQSVSHNIAPQLRRSTTLSAGSVPSKTYAYWSRVIRHDLMDKAWLTFTSFMFFPLAEILHKETHRVVCHDRFCSIPAFGMDMHLVSLRSSPQCCCYSSRF